MAVATCSSTNELLIPFLTGHCSSCHVLRLNSCRCPVRSGDDPEEKMPPPPPAPIRLGPPRPYLKTHGSKVARLHLFDWIVLALLVAIDVGLNLIEPFHRFVGEDMITDLRYPLKSNTIPVWAVPVRHLYSFFFVEHLYSLSLQMKTKNCLLESGLMFRN